MRNPVKFPVEVLATIAEMTHSTFANCLRDFECTVVDGCIQLTDGPVTVTIKADGIVTGKNNSNGKEVLWDSHWHTSGDPTNRTPEWLEQKLYDLRNQ